MLNHSSRSFRKIALAAAGASAALMLVACSGGGATGSAPAPQATVTVTETPSEPSSTTPTSSSTQSSASTVETELSSGSAHAPDAVIGDNAANFRLGAATPGDGTSEDVEVEASARQKNASGFNEAWIEILDRDSNGLLRFPLSDGSATVMVNFRFKADTDVNCAVDLEVYDATGHETLGAATHLESSGDNECSILATGAIKTGDAFAEFSEPGEYYIVVQAQQADHDPIRLAQKILITSGEISDGES